MHITAGVQNTQPEKHLPNDVRMTKNRKKSESTWRSFEANRHQWLCTAPLPATQTGNGFRKPRHWFQVAITHLVF